MLTKTEGLILKVNKLGENDCLYTILTKDMKKITAISKGIRSLKHKDFAALKLFCYSEIELSGNNRLFSINNSNVINNFFGIRESVEKLCFASYIAEVASIVSEFTEGDNEYFRLILNTLYFIEKASETNEINELKKLKCLFELRSAAFSGFAPNFDNCVCCNSSKNIVYFDIEAGGVVCDDCKTEFSYPVGLDVVNTMKYICCGNLKDAFNLKITKQEVLDNINDISEKYISVKSEYYFPTLDYLKKIMENPM